MKNAIYLSVIIPCYNEHENLKHGVLDEVWNFLKTLALTWELVISDDGSTDDSCRAIEKFMKDKPRVRLLKNQHGGKPAAVYSGITAAQGEYCLFTDMDQSTPIRELKKMLPYFHQYQVVIGSRRDRKNSPLYRRFGSKVFQIVRRSLILPGVHDTQCGFKVFKTSLARQIFPQLDFLQGNGTRISGWKVSSFDIELLYLAELRQQKIKEVIVDWEDRDRAQNKNKNYWKESKEMLIQILKVKWKSLRSAH
jgi:dolichyl-phosphate beta-glucosyltransferase